MYFLKLIISKGYCWIITTTIITALCSFMLYSMRQTKHPVLLGIGIVLLILFIASYACTALKCPGFPDRDLSKYSREFIEELVKSGSPRFCPRCKIVKSIWKKTVHCSLCDVCIEGYDHHCVWTSKCIGHGNILPFGIFNVSVLILIIYMGVLAILSRT